jgi:predicted secreted hydrolase
MAVSAGGAEYTLVPLLDDQELDSRASTGTIYWEGAVRVQQGGREVGRGYLELTGYWKPLQL